MFHGTLQGFGGLMSGLLGTGSLALFTLPVNPIYLLSREEVFLHAFSSPRIGSLSHLMSVLPGFAFIEATDFFSVVFFEMKRWLLSSCTFWDLPPMRGGFSFLLWFSMQRRISWVLLSSEMSSDIFLVYPLCSLISSEKA